LPGLLGFVEAYNTGFTQKQIQDIKSVLSTSKGGEVVVTKTKNLLDPLTPEEQKKQDSVTLLLTQGKVEEAFPKPHDLPAEYESQYTTWVERVRSVFTSPKLKDIEVINTIIKSKATPEQLNQILDLFALKNPSPQLEMINKRIQFENPIGKALWGSYIPALNREILVYSKHYSEAPKSRLRNIEDVKDLPQGLTLLDIIRKGEIEPKKRNTATEDIITLKLERLAEWYGMDLENENDLVRFSAFMHQFDLSPGERTLDFTVDAHPPEHTFEELPIIKLPEGEKIEDNLGF